MTMLMIMFMTTGITITIITTATGMTRSTMTTARGRPTRMRRA